MTDWNKYPTFSDRLLAFALKEGPVNPELVGLAQRHGTPPDAAAARHYYEVFERAASDGSAYAMCVCSRCCVVGWGRPQSHAEAFRWAKNAAATGFAPGHFDLGSCYEQGLGVQRDLDQARYHYELAVEGGFGFAGYQLAMLYHSGGLGGRNTMKAIEWAKRAYELREPMAANVIANWYEAGEGMPRSDQDAVLWYERAVALGDMFASHRLSMAYAAGDLGLPKDQELSRKYLSICESQMPELGA